MHHRAHCIIMLNNTRRQDINRSRGRLIEYKSTQKFEGNEARACLLCEAKINYITPIQIGGFSKKRFIRKIMLTLIKPKLVFTHMPTGEGTRRLLDILLGIIAFTQAEEFHHFARKVFIRVTFAVGITIEPNKHSHILGHLL